MGNTATGTIVGFFSAIILAFAVIYGSIMLSLPFWGSGWIPTDLATTFMMVSIFQQIRFAIAQLLLNVTSAYILGSIIWLLSGLIGGLFTRDVVKGVSAGLVSAISMALVCWIVVWVIDGYFPDVMALLNQILLDQLLGWVINGVLAGIIAGVGGAVGGTLTSQRETR